MLILIGLSCLLPLSAEVAVRARLFFKEPYRWDDQGLFRYRPQCQVGDTPELTTNRLGFFGTQLSPSKDPGAYRIFLVGSSPITSPTIPAALAGDLTQHFAQLRFEVNATGLPRYTSYHDLALYDRYLAPLHPDCLIIYLGLNDNVYNTNPGLHGAPPTGLWNWADTSHSLVLEMLLYHGLHKRFRTTPNFTATPSAAIFQDHLDHIISAARSCGTAVILVKMAVAYPTDDPDLLAAIRASEGPMKHFWGLLDPALQGLATHNRALDTLAAKYDIPCIDPAPCLPKVHSVFRDLCHFTPEGETLFAAFLAQTLTEIHPGRLP